MHLSKSMSAALTLLFFVIVFQVVGGLIGWTTAQEIDGWYNTLVKSPYTPPNKFFGMAWSFLYLLLAISFFLIYQSDRSEIRKKALLLFAAHMILNWLWSPLFFTFHQLGAAAALLLMLVASAVVLALYSKRVHVVAATLFIPYLLWLCFAAYLALYIWRYN